MCMLANGNAVHRCSGIGSGQVTTNFESRPRAAAAYPKQAESASGREKRAASRLSQMRTDVHHDVLLENAPRNTLLMPVNLYPATLTREIVLVGTIVAKGRLTGTSSVLTSTCTAIISAVYNETRSNVRTSARGVLGDY